MTGIYWNILEYTAVWTVRTLVVCAPFSSHDLCLSGPSLVNMSTLIWGTLDGGGAFSCAGRPEMCGFVCVVCGGHWQPRTLEGEIHFRRGWENSEDTEGLKTRWFKSPSVQELLSITLLYPISVPFLLRAVIFSRCMWPFTYHPLPCSIQFTSGSHLWRGESTVSCKKYLMVFNDKAKRWDIVS